MHTLSGETLMPLAFVISVIGGIAYAVFHASKLSFLVEKTELDFNFHKNEQNEFNKEILEKLNEISRDVAVIKQRLK